ncbi:hypothetical protein B0H11DRAFT_2417353 [Mycena galericulata]|nr:hypothetical protein B0H11DRAFT_2417353 [Mycena galericulata]
MSVPSSPQALIDTCLKGERRGKDGLDCGYSPPRWRSRAAHGFPGQEGACKHETQRTGRYETETGSQRSGHYETQRAGRYETVREPIFLVLGSTAGTVLQDSRAVWGFPGQERGILGIFEPFTAIFKNGVYGFKEEWVTPNESERKTAVPTSTASAASVPMSQTFVPPTNLPIPALSTAPGGQNTFPPCPQDAVAHFHPHLYVSLLRVGLSDAHPFTLLISNPSRDGLGTAPIVLRADYPKCQDGCCGSSTITRGPTAVRPTPTPTAVLEEASTAVLTPVSVVELGNTDGTGNLNAGFDLGDLRGKSDDGERIRLTDFAIAKAISEALGALGISTVMAIPLQPVSHPVSFPAVHVIHPSSGGASAPRTSANRRKFPPSSIVHNRGIIAASSERPQLSRKDYGCAINPPLIVRP